MQPSKRRETTDCEILISVQKCWYGEICVLSRSSPAGDQWCPAPHFTFWPTGCCIHSILYIQNVPPFWFMAPPSGFWPPLFLNTGDWPVYCTCCSRQNPQSVVHILLKFAKRQSNEIYHSLWTSHFSAGMLVRWNIHTVATAVQPTLVEMTNHWCNLLENSAKLKNAEKPQIPNFAFHCRNAVLVKHVNVL